MQEIREKKYYKSKNYDLIPSNHRCKKCNGDRDIVNFQVHVYADKDTHIRKTCLMCDYEEDILKREGYKKQRKERHGHRVKAYFQSKEFKLSLLKPHHRLTSI